MSNANLVVAADAALHWGQCHAAGGAGLGMAPHRLHTGSPRGWGCCVPKPAASDPSELPVASVPWGTRVTPVALG